eukprot:240725-Amphidinium_carterae.1
MDCRPITKSCPFGFSWFTLGSLLLALVLLKAFLHVFAPLAEKHASSGGMRPCEVGACVAKAFANQCWHLGTAKTPTEVLKFFETLK